METGSAISTGWAGRAVHHQGVDPGGVPPEALAPEPPEAAAPEPPGAAAPDVQDAPEATIVAVEEVLDQVDAALARLDDGTYGRCTRCGDPLDDGRLAGDPTALLCGGCASTPTG